METAAENQQALRHFEEVFRQREAAERAFREGTATVITCDYCHQERDARHVLLTRISAVGLGENVFMCGPCLDNLAECLYRACSKEGVPHWRRSVLTECEFCLGAEANGAALNQELMLAWSVARQLLDALLHFAGLAGEDTMGMLVRWVTAYRLLADGDAHTLALVDAATRAKEVPTT